MGGAIALWRRERLGGRSERLGERKAEKAPCPGHRPRPLVSAIGGFGGLCDWISDRDSDRDPDRDPEMESRPRLSTGTRDRGTNGFQPLEGRGPSRPRVSLCPDPVGGFPQRCEETKNFCGGSLCFKGSGFSGVQHSPLIAQRSVPVGSGWVEPDPSSLTPLEGRLPRRPDRR